MKRILAVVISLMMTITMVPSMAFAASLDNCDGSNCTHEAAIGSVHYDTLEEAITASISGQTIELLKEINNSIDGAAYSSTRSFALKAGTILDGKGKTITGDASVSIPPEGATVQNVIFKDIHDNVPVPQKKLDQYKVPAKIGYKSAIYAAGLTGKAVITGCTFDNMDWEAIQMTPKAGAQIEITNNIFKGNTDESWQLRHLHIEPSRSKDVLGDVTITDNQFFKSIKAFNTYSLGLYDTTFNSNTKLNGNYVEDESTIDIPKNTTVPLLYPMRSDANVDKDDLSHAIYAGKKFFDTFGDALANSKSATMYMVQNNSEKVAIPAGKTIELYPCVSAFNGEIENNGTLIVKDGSAVVATGTIKNNGKLELSGNAATGYTIVNNGTLCIEGGATFDLSKITGSGKVEISGGTFTTEPKADQLREWYKVTNLGSSFTVERMNDSEAIAAGAVASDKSNRNKKYFRSISKGLETENTVKLMVDNYTEDMVIDGYQSVSSIDLNEKTLNGSLVMQGKTKSVKLSKKGTVNLTNVVGDELVVDGQSKKENTVTIDDGSLNALRVTANGTANINKGKYKEVTLTSYYSRGVETKKSKLTVKGGLFATDKVKVNFINHKTANGLEYEYKNLADYIPEGYVVVPSNVSGYGFEVKAKADTVAKPAVGEAKVDDKSLPSAMTDDQKTAVKNAAASVAPVDASTLANAANVATSKVTEKQGADAKKAYKESGLEGASNAEDANIHIYTEAYLQIKPVDYKTGETNVLKLDIEPMYRVIASTVEVGSENKLIVKGEAGLGETANAVVLANSEKPLKSINTMNISVTLPEGFPTDNLKVKHYSSSGVFYYNPNVNNLNVTFTVTHGFSLFDLLTDGRKATVQFNEKDKAVVLAPENIGETLPVGKAPAGQVFDGWQFDGIDGVYTTLTDELLTALSKNEGTITPKPQFHTPSYGGGGGSTPVQKPSVEIITQNDNLNKGAEVIFAADGKSGQIKVDTGFELVDVKVNGVSKGKVTALNNLKPTDKIVVITKKVATEGSGSASIGAVKTIKLVAYTKVVKLKSGKKVIKVTWKAKNGSLKDLDGIQVFRSTKGKVGTFKKVYTGKKAKYVQKSLKKGQKYYYKVRGFVKIDGKNYYTKFSKKVVRRA